MRIQVVLLLALLSPAAPALAQSQSHPGSSHSTAARLDPVGTFDLAFDLHGEPTKAILRVTRESNGSLKGTLDVHGQSMPLDTVSTVNRVVRLASGSELTLTLTFSTDNEFTGTWTGHDGGSGTLTGTRRKP
jgi:hypothetical protein